MHDTNLLTTSAARVSFAASRVRAPAPAPLLQSMVHEGRRMKKARASVLAWLVLAVFPLVTLVAGCATTTVVAPEPVTLEEPESEEEEEAEDGSSLAALP